MIRCNLFCLFFIALTAPVNAFADPHLKKTALCAALLTQGRDYFAPAARQQETAAAFRFFQGFRQRFIGQRSDEPNFQSVSFDKSGKSGGNLDPSRLQRLSQRFAGIEMNYRYGSSSNTDPLTDQIVAGFVMDAEQGVHFLESYRATAQSYHDVWRNQFKASELRLAKAGFEAGIGVPLTLLVGEHLHWFSLPTVGHIVASVIPGTILWYAIRLPFSFDMNGYLRRTQHMEELLKQTTGSSDRWIADGTEFELKASVVEKLAGTGASAENPLNRQYAIDMAWNPIFEIFGQKPDPQSFRRIAPVRVLVDRVVYSDPRSGKPALGIFVRYSHKKPGDFLPDK